MKRSISFILFMALTMLSWQVALPAKASQPEPRSDITAETSADGEASTAEAAEQTAPPSIMIPEPLFTFDTVVDGSEVVHDFRIYNRGSGELAIEKVQTG